MARTVLTAQTFVTAGLTPAVVEPHADGASFRNTGRCVLMVVNGSANPVNVTPKIAKAVEGVVPESPARAVAAGVTRFFGPFDEDAYRQSAGGTMFVDFSAVTDVDVALLQMP